MIPEAIFLLLLTTVEKEPPELPPPENEYVYCYLMIQRDEDDKLIGLNEKCNDG